MSNGEKIDVSKKDRIIKDAYLKLDTFSKRGYAPAEQSEDIRKWLEEQEEVEEVSVYEETDITVKFKDKTRVGILLDRKKMYGGSPADVTSKDIKSPNFRMAPGSDPHPVSKKAAVIDTLKDDWPPDSTPDDIYNTLNTAGYSVDYITNDSADLQFFAELENKEYGVVFIRSHGAVLNVDGEDKLHIMVRPFFSTYPPDSGYSGVEIFTVGTDVLPQGYAYTYSFNNEFVEQYMKNRHFPNSLLHLLVCHGADPLAENDMIKSLLEIGVGCYTGWTKSATLAHGDPAAVQFFKILCDPSANPTNTVQDAIYQITSAGHSPDPGNGAELVAHGPNNMQIINCSIIKETSHISVKTPNGKVIGKGFHDILDAVEYGTNQINGGKYPRLTINHSIELKKIRW